MKKRKEALKEKFSFLNQGLTCGLDNSQVKDAKANHTCPKSNYHKTFREEEKTIKKSIKQERLNQS